MATGRATGVPIALTSFIGRQRELEELRRLLATKRQVTLTGAGGSGKSRLASELAASLRAEFPEGSFWVPLAPITDQELVASAVAQTVGIQGLGDRPQLDAVGAFLRDQLEPGDTVVGRGRFCPPGNYVAAWGGGP